MEKDLPAGAGPPITDTERHAATRRLHDLVTDGLPLEMFSMVLEQVLAARDHVELEAALSALPPIIQLTPPSLRSGQPVEADARTHVLKLGSGWQLGAVTRVRSSTGICHLDLTKATWDSAEVDLTLQTGTGIISVVIPRGVAVQMRSTRGHVVTKGLEAPLPGGPVLRITASAATGIIKLTHPSQSKRRTRRRFWRRRRMASA